MIRTLNGVTPKVAETAWVSEFAYVVGNVEIGEYSQRLARRDRPRRWRRRHSHRRLRQHTGRLGDSWQWADAEDHVSVGHSVVVHCDRVGSGSLLGNNCTILNNVDAG